STIETTPRVVCATTARRPPTVSMLRGPGSVGRRWSTLPVATESAATWDSVSAVTSTSGEAAASLRASAAGAKGAAPATARNSRLFTRRDTDASRREVRGYAAHGEGHLRKKPSSHRTKRSAIRSDHTGGS